MNTAKHLGREQVVTACGRSWTVGRWTRKVWWEFLAWARDTLPDPLDAVEKTLTRFAEQQSALYRQAGESKDAARKAELERQAEILDAKGRDLVNRALEKRMHYLSVNSPEVQTLLASLEGTVMLLWLLLRDKQEATLDDAYDVAMELKDQLVELFAVAQGKVPAGESGNASDPAA